MKKKKRMVVEGEEYIQAKASSSFGACFECDLYDTCKGAWLNHCVDEISLDVWKRKAKKPKGKKGIKVAFVIIVFLLLFTGMAVGILALPYIDAYGGKCAAVCFAFLNLIAIVIMADWMEGRKW